LDRAYEYDVRDDGGNLVPKAVRSAPEEGNGWSGIPRAIKPGETCEARGGSIDHLYDMTRPGKYTIQVSRRISNDPKDGVVKSNIITVTVTP
jgi:hypothetical protein